MQLKKKRLLTLLLFFFVIICFAIAAIPNFRKNTKPSPDGNLQLHFLDVGQGDASLIICDGHAMLIDGGDSSSSRKIYTYLSDLGINHLEYIVSTHPHDDHTAGLSGALNYAKADVALSPVAEADGSGFQNFLKYLHTQGTTITIPRPGDSFTLGSCEFRILAPSQITNDWNNNSIVFLLSYGDFRVLYTGDAEFSEEQEILNNYKSIHANLLKVGHHGGADASGQDFLAAVSPRVAIISCGADNEYGHPSRQTLLRLESVSASVLRTDLLGDIVITVQPNGIYYIHTNTTNTAENQPISDKEADYIVNTKSGKFHLPDCASAKDIASGHRMEYSGSRDQLISMGYEPCSRCNP